LAEGSSLPSPAPRRRIQRHWRGCHQRGHAQAWADADQKTGKPVATTTRYTYQDGDDRDVLSFSRSDDCRQIG
jgi:hypothetical protein